MSTEHANATGYVSGYASGPNRWKRNTIVTVAGLIILVAGIAIGACLSAVHFRNRLATATDSTEALGKMITARLAKTVELSPEEMSDIEKVVGTHVAEVSRMREDFGNAITQHINCMQNNICDILGDERTGMCGEWLKPPEGGVAGEHNDTGGTHRFFCPACVRPTTPELHN